MLMVNKKQHNRIHIAKKKYKTRSIFFMNDFLPLMVEVMFLVDDHLNNRTEEFFVLLVVLTENQETIFDIVQSIQSY